MKLIYFPGFGGSQKSLTFQSLLEKYNDSEAVLYDNENANIAIEQIEKQINFPTLSKNTLIIGQSLGGFWAEHFAIKYNLNLILINPSLNPHLSLKKYNLSTEKLDAYKSYKSNDFVKSQITIILSKNDTTVDPKPVIEKYNDIAKFKLVDGDHNFKDYNTLINEIELMDNCKR